MSLDVFDPEDFLNLKPAAAGTPSAALPPIVTPPSYVRNPAGAEAPWSPAPARPVAPAMPPSMAPATAPVPAPAAAPDLADLPIVAPPVYPRRGAAAPRPAAAPVLAPVKAPAAATVTTPAFRTRRPAAAVPAYVPQQDALAAIGDWEEAHEEYDARPLAEPAYAAVGGGAAYRAPQLPHRYPATSGRAPKGPDGRAWLRVICEGIELNLRAWNAESFTLETPLNLDVETLQMLIFDVTLQIGQGATRVEMQARARADLDALPPGERFFFVDQDEEQAEILARAAGLGLARKPVSVIQLMTPTAAPQPRGPAPQAPAPQAPETQAPETEAWDAEVAGPAPAAMPKAEPAAPEAATPAATPSATPAATPSATPSGSPAAPRRFRPSLRALALLGILGGVGGFVWNNATVVPARYGAVTIEAARLSATAAGTLDWLPLQPGQSVETGEILGHLRPAEPDLSPLIARLVAEANDPMTPRAPLAAAPAPTPVLAPCDCRLVEVLRPAGAEAAAGEALAVLTAREAPAIQVLVRADEALRLAPGQMALIDLADGSRLQGRVARLPAELQGAEVLGLSQNVFGAENYARVEIRPDQPLTAPAGTRAEVTLVTSGPWGWLRGQLHALRGEVRAITGF